MWKSIANQIGESVQTMCNTVVWTFSFLLGAFLSAIGYPKEVLSFIFWLVIIDLITKQYSIVVVKFGSFTVRTYLDGWRQRVLTSRGLKDGLGVKALLYTPILYIAHKMSIVQELMFGSALSSVLYSLLIIIEIISILENFDDAGHKEVAPLVRLFKKKKGEITGEGEEE